jgi:hypothetical protein
MKILVNSKYLYNELKKWNFTKSIVEQVVLIGHELTFIGEGQKLTIYIEPIKSTGNYWQDNRHWDDVRDIVRNVPEQPIVLEISEGIVRVIFEV